MAPWDLSLIRRVLPRALRALRKRTLARNCKLRRLDPNGTPAVVGVIIIDGKHGCFTSQLASSLVTMALAPLVTDQMDGLISQTSSITSCTIYQGFIFDYGRRPVERSSTFSGFRASSSVFPLFSGTSLPGRALTELCNEYHE